MLHFPKKPAPLSLSVNYTLVRPLFGGRLTQLQVNGLEGLLAACTGLPKPYIAYLLATAMHETDRTMQPIREYGRGAGKKYGRPGRNGGQVPYGRGYVQITWDDNYERADRELGLGGALIRDYDLALQTDIAARILIRGSTEGWFTGRRLAHFLNGDKPDYVEARRVINGTDRAREIAAYATIFDAALS